MCPMILVGAKYKTPVLKFTGTPVSQQVQYMEIPYIKYLGLGQYRRLGSRENATTVWDLRELVPAASLWVLALKLCGQVFGLNP